jgi:hypothetical protein
MNMRSVVALAVFGALGRPAMAVEVKPLISGDSVPGWEEKGGQPPSWPVRDGVLTCAGGKGGWFGPRAECTDFIIGFEFRLPPGGNSGVYRILMKRPRSD